MTVVVPNDLVRLEIPALHHLVFAARKEVRMARRNSKTPNGADVSRQRQLESATAQIPDLDGTICRPTGKPLVVRLDRQ